MPDDRRFRTRSLDDRRDHSRSRRRDRLSLSPGKRPLSAATVQRQRAPGRGSPEPEGTQAVEAAARGVSGAGEPLPHLERIQTSFGRHDLRGVTARVGGEARAAAEALGAEAYATGTRVGFREPPDLRTAAHEAAHLVQQRGGVQPSGGIGRQGDIHERHADAVAERVVRGESSEALLGEPASPAAAAPVGRAVQRFVKLKGDEISQKEVENLAGAAFAYWETWRSIDEGDDGWPGYPAPAGITIEALRSKLSAWVACQPYKLPRATTGSVKIPVGLDDAQAYASKAYWKKFGCEQELFLQLIGETDPLEQQAREDEEAESRHILADAGLAARLDDLRTELGDELWAKDDWKGRLSYYVTTTILNFLPNMGGSYNLGGGRGGGYPPKKHFGGRTDRMSLLFDRRRFTVAHNVAILHDIKELFTDYGHNRRLPTAHATVVPPPYTTAARRSGADPQDRGVKHLGVRDEYSEDTIRARKEHRPVESGRSFTVARLLEMVNVLHPGKEATPEQLEAHGQKLRDVATAIFAYWNAHPSGSHEPGYPAAMTPVHTRDEVMEVLDDYLVPVEEAIARYGSSSAPGPEPAIGEAPALDEQSGDHRLAGVIRAMVEQMIGSVAVEPGPEATTELIDAEVQRWIGREIMPALAELSSRREIDRDAVAELLRAKLPRLTAALREVGRPRAKL